jgi:hypothetical protein
MGDKLILAKVRSPEVAQPIRLVTNHLSVISWKGESYQPVPMTFSEPKDGICYVSGLGKQFWPWILNKEFPVEVTELRQDKPDEPTYATIWKGTLFTESKTPSSGPRFAIRLDSDAPQHPYIVEAPR